MNYFPISILLGGGKRSEFQRLKGNGIVTVLDYMKENKQKLRDKLVFQKMQRQDVDSLFSLIDEEIANLKLTEQDILNQLFQEQKPRAPEYLHFAVNIFPVGGISLLIGDIGSGKTTLIFDIMKEQLLNSNKTILYLDCGENLVVKRIFNQYRCKLSEEVTKTIFSKIQYHSFECIKDFEEFLEKIPNGQIVVIDGLLTLYAENDKEVYNLQRLIYELFKYLFHLTQTQQNTFIISIRNIQENISQIQATKFDQFINCYASAIVHLILIRQDRVMKIHKSVNPNLEYDTSVLFQLTEGGIIWKQ